MFFELESQHTLLRESLKKVISSEIEPLIEDAERNQRFPVTLFPKMGDIGYLCLTCSEEYGGAGLDKVAECIWTEELSKACCGIAGGLIVHSTLGSIPIDLFGSPQQKESYLSPAIKGEKIGAFALTEPNAGSDAAGIQTKAIKQGDYYILNGTKMFITNGSICDYAIVAAYTDPQKRGSGISLFIVDRKLSGFSVPKKLEKAGLHSSEVAELLFEDCQVPKENLLGEEGNGLDKLTNLLSGGRIIYGSRAIGVAEAAYEASLKYAQERIQFGQPISKFQITKFKLAEMIMLIHTARLLTYDSARLFDQGKPCVKEASMTKLFATEMATKVTYEALQIHGGYGYMREFPVERYWRDARLLTITEGTSEIQHLVIARAVGL